MLVPTLRSIKCNKNSFSDFGVLSARTDRQTDRQTDRRKNKRADREMDRQMARGERQSDINRHMADSRKTDDLQVE
jgi:hypothetical protein